MQPAKRVAVNTGILYAKMAITVFISLYATRLILAALGAEDYGIFNVVGGAIAMLTFLNIAMASASQRFMSFAQGEGDEQKQKYIFNVSITLHFLIAIVIFLLLQVAGYFLFNGILEIPEERMDIAKLLFQFMLVSTFFTIVSVPYDAVLNAHENMLLVAILGIIESVLKLAIAIYITYTAFDKLLTFGILMVSLPILLLVLRSSYCHRKYEEVELAPKKYYNKQLFKEMTSFASWALLSSAASIVAMQGITIILNSFFGVIVNAAQGIANQVSGQLSAFSNTMLKALNPVIVKSEGAKNRDQMLRASLTGNKVSFFLLAFFAVPVIIEMPFILDIWLKDVPEYAIIFCRLSLIRACIEQLTITFGTAIGATGRIKQVSIWNSITYGALLPATYIAFKAGASPEAVYINLICIVVALAIIKVYFTWRLCGLKLKRFFADVLMRSLLTTFFAAVLAHTPLLILDESFIRLGMVCLFSATTFLALLFMVGLENDEKQLILSAYRSVIAKIRSKSRNS